MVDGENDIQDIGRELRDMLKDIDSISLQSSKALAALDGRSVLRSQDVACYESSVECIKVLLTFDHLLLLNA